MVGGGFGGGAVVGGWRGAGGLVGGPAGRAEEGVGELLGVLLGGVGAGPQAGNVDVVDESGRGGVAGKVGEVEAAQVVFGETVGVVVGVGWGFVQIVRKVDAGGVQVVLGSGRRCFGL